MRKDPSLGNAFGAFDARTNFRRLLDRVERGETIVITRHGVPIAKLVPVDEAFDRSKARRAAAELKSFAKGNCLPKGLSLQRLADEGRV
jgi:prevent-host-death family protein